MMHCQQYIVRTREIKEVKEPDKLSVEYND
jgi:hypothetical protein